MRNHHRRRFRRLTARAAIIAGALVLVICGIALSAPRSHGSLTNRDAVYPASPLTWGNPVALHHSGQGRLVGIACPSASQCTGVDGGGAEVTFDPASAGFPAATEIDNAVESGYDYGMTGVACPATTECVAVDGNGNEVTFNPQAPGTPTPVALAPSGYYGDEYLESVACPTTTQCTVVDDLGQEATFNPQAAGLTSFHALGSGGDAYATSLSCPTATQCTAVGGDDGGGTWVTFDPQTATVSSPVQVNQIGTLSGIACSSATACSAVAYDGHEVTLNPQVPTSGTTSSVDSNGGVDSVACPSGAECVATDQDGNEVTYDPQAVGSPVAHLIDSSEVTGIACSDAIQCTAVDGSGREGTFNPTNFDSPSLVAIDDNSDLGGISCPIGSQCTTVDNTGHEMTFDPTAPGTPTPATIDPGAQLNGISCPTASQCTAVDSAGHEVTFNPTSPGAPTPATIDSGIALNAVSCSSGSQCTAVDEDGQEVTFSPTSPGTPTPAVIDDTTDGLTGIACPSSSQCTAADENGQEVTFNPTAPGTPSPVTLDSDDDAPAGIACPSTSQCTVVDSWGSEATFDPTNPGTPTASHIDGGSGVACPSASLCVSVGAYYNGSAITVSTTPGGGSDAWSWPPDNPDPFGLTAVSCASSSLCVAVDNAGDAVVGIPGSAPGVPVATTPPTIDSGVTEGEETYASPGSWTNNPTSYSYQWEDCNTSGTACADNPAATDSNTYTPTASDVGHTLRVVVVATNAGGNSSPATSGPSNVIAASPPINVSPPTISGSPVQGQTLTEGHGTWSNSPTGYGYQWSDCNANGNRCSAIAGATGQSYALVAGDVGHTIRVEETAVNDVGDSYPVDSAHTAVVTAAPVTGTPGTTPVTPPSTTPGGSQPVTTSAGLTAGQVRGLLLHILGVSGKGGRIARLLKQDGYVVSVTAPTAGKLTISWYYLPKGAHLAKAKHGKKPKPVLIASASVVFHKAGTAKVKIVLTGKGRQMLKSASHLGLVAKGTFTPNGQSATSTTKAITLKR